MTTATRHEVNRRHGISRERVLELAQKYGFDPNDGLEEEARELAQAATAEIKELAKREPQTEGEARNLIAALALAQERINLAAAKFNLVAELKKGAAAATDRSHLAPAPEATDDRTDAERKIHIRHGITNERYRELQQRYGA